MQKTFFKTFVLFTAVLIGSTALANGNAVATQRPFSDSLKLKPAFITVKKSVVKLYPNPTWSGTVKVSTNLNGEALHFYVFDVEGTLIGQAFLQDKQPHTIGNLKKGVYVYEVFKNDESIEQGKIFVK